MIYTTVIHERPFITVMDGKGMNNHNNIYLICTDIKNHQQRSHHHHHNHHEHQDHNEWESVYVCACVCVCSKVNKCEIWTTLGTVIKIRAWINNNNRIKIKKENNCTVGIVSWTAIATTSATLCSFIDCFVCSFRFVSFVGMYIQHPLSAII